jgi:hypothetical protein
LARRIQEEWETIADGYPVLRRGRYEREGDTNGAKITSFGGLICGKLILGWWKTKSSEL